MLTDKTDRLAVGVITLIFAAATLLAHSPDDIPLIDDWTYAWSIEHFLETGKLQVLDWSAHYPLAQIVWAGLFAKILGFSYAVLRASTLVLGWLGLLAFFFTLRAIGVAPFASALGALTLFFNPVFFVLAYSFMTDIPFVSMMNMAVLGYVLWARKKSSGWLLFGALCATAAFLMRQIGAALPLVPIAYLMLSQILSEERRALTSREWLYLLFPFLCIGLTMWWIREIHGTTMAYREKTQAIKYFFDATWWLSLSAVRAYFDGMVRALFNVSLVLWILTLPSLAGRSKHALLTSAALVLLILGLYEWQSGHFPRLLSYGETLSLEELGASRPLIPPKGGDMSREMRSLAEYALLALALISSVAMIGAVFGQLKRGRLPTPASAILVLNTLLQFLLIEVLWLYYDRYYLTLLPGLIALFASDIKWTRLQQLFVSAGVLIFAAISISGTIDNFRFNRAVSAAREWLLSQGIPPWQIDAGYVLNGWWLYAHPENLQPGAQPEFDVQFVTAQVDLPYKVANYPFPFHEVIHTFTFESIWAVSDRIYVLKRLNGAASTSSSRP